MYRQAHNHQEKHMQNLNHVILLNLIVSIMRGAGSIKCVESITIKRVMEE